LTMPQRLPSNRRQSAPRSPSSRRSQHNLSLRRRSASKTTNRRRPNKSISYADERGGVLATVADENTESHYTQALSEKSKLTRKVRRRSSTPVRETRKHVKNSSLRTGKRRPASRKSRQTKSEGLKRDSHGRLRDKRGRFVSEAARG
uniref:ICP4 n=1 Tax=Angiostrongylus cantonensis TaxID=6313 RepID=A0A0K0CZX6_ANGCA